MEIFISRNNQTLGPYPREVVEEWINQGKVFVSDSACTSDGAWQPLGKLLGRKEPSVISLGGIVAIVVVALSAVVLTALISLKASKAPSKAASVSRVACDPSAAKQSERREAVNELISRGVFSKIEKPGTLPHVYVGSRFYTLNFDQKKTVMELVYCRYFTEDDGVVRIFESMNGKEIGKYTITFGLEMN